MENGVTTLTGAVADQAALRGVLTRILDSNLVLISVARVQEQHTIEEVIDA